MKSDNKYDTNFYITGLVLIAMSIILIIIFQVFGTAWLALLPKCFFHITTGYYCPGCGGTRAIIYLFKGQLLKSFFYHPLVLYLAIVGGWFMISQTIERISASRIKIGMHFRTIYLWIAVILITVNFVIKNGTLLLFEVALM